MPMPDITRLRSLRSLRRKGFEEFEGNLWRNIWKILRETGEGRVEDRRLDPEGAGGGLADRGKGDTVRTDVKAGVLRAGFTGWAAKYHCVEGRWRGVGKRAETTKGGKNAAGQRDNKAWSERKVVTMLNTVVITGANWLK
jgi:hypothetical protein